MRLISQDGRIDIPYENSVVYIHANYDYNWEMEYDITGYKIVTPIGGYDTWLVLGEYSTEEKALKVMEMLQNQYKRFMTTGLIDIKKENIYFRFPADEDVKESDK